MELNNVYKIALCHICMEMAPIHAFHYVTVQNMSKMEHAFHYVLLECMIMYQKCVFQTLHFVIFIKKFKSHQFA